MHVQDGVFVDVGSNAYPHISINLAVNRPDEVNVSLHELVEIVLSVHFISLVPVDEERPEDLVVQLREVVLAVPLLTLFVLSHLHLRFILFTLEFTVHLFLHVGVDDLFVVAHSPFFEVPMVSYILLIGSVDLAVVSFSSIRNLFATLLHNWFIVLRYQLLLELEFVLVAFLKVHNIFFTSLQWWQHDLLSKGHESAKEQGRDDYEGEGRRDDHTSLFELGIVWYF